MSIIDSKVITSYYNGVGKFLDIVNEVIYKNNYNVIIMINLFQCDHLFIPEDQLEHDKNKIVDGLVFTTTIHDQKLICFDKIKLYNLLRICIQDSAQAIDIDLKSNDVSGEFNMDSYDLDDITIHELTYIHMEYMQQRLFGIDIPSVIEGYTVLRNNVSIN